MFVLGVDPGVARCGFAVLSRSRARIEVESAGLIETPASDALPRRLLEIYRHLCDLIAEFEVSCVVVERVLFQTNAKSAMAVAQASGAALMAAATHDVRVVQISTNEMKLSLVGDGAATKMQIQSMVQRLLHLDSAPKPPDIADAIGLAYCYLSGSELARSGWSMS